MQNPVHSSFKGPCPICQRPMYQMANSIDKHHFVPKSKGGKASEFIHRICHQKIHSLFTEKQLAAQYASAEALLTDPDIQTFVAWIKNKDPLFYVSVKTSKQKKR